MQIPIALAETIGGILLIIGVLSRISSSILSIIMLGAIFIVKGASNLIEQGGYVLDLLILAGTVNYCRRTRQNINFTQPKRFPDSYND